MKFTSTGFLTFCLLCAINVAEGKELMIKPIDNNIAMTRPAAFNPAFCAAPTVYENVSNSQPVGQKLDLTCTGCGKPKGVGEKLDRIV